MIAGFDGFCSNFASCDNDIEEKENEVEIKSLNVTIGAQIGRVNDKMELSFIVFDVEQNRADKQQDLLRFFFVLRCRTFFLTCPTDRECFIFLGDLSNE